MTSFDKMKNDTTVNYSWIRKDKFLRKGIVGDWKNFLTAEQSAEIDSVCAERLGKLEFRYE